MKFISTILLTLIISFFLISCSTGPLISQGEIFKNLTQITYGEGDNYSPVVSNDGSKFMFVSSRDGDENIYLRSNPFDRTEIRKTSHAGDDITPCFSPDGEKICFASNRNGNYDLFVMDTEGGFAKTLLTNSDENELFPSWSPDGKQIAYSQYSLIEGEWYLWIKQLSNGAQKQICKGLMPKFSKDGKWIYYKRTNDGYYQLWKIDLDAVNETQLTSGDKWGIGTYSVSPNGNMIIYSTTMFEYKLNPRYSGADIWVLNLDNGEQTQLTTHKGSDTYPVWSPFGDIFFSSDRMGNLNIWSFRTPF